MSVERKGICFPRMIVFSCFFEYSFCRLNSKAGAPLNLLGKKTTYGLCAWCGAWHMTPANRCTELTLLSEAESSLSSSPFRLGGPEQLMRLSMQTQKLTEKPGAWSSCSFHGQELCGWWDVIWGWSTALFCPLTQNAGDSRHLRSMSPGLWQHTSHWAAACIPVFNGGNASAASAPHLPTGLSFDSTVGGRKANLWEGKAKQK